jgi:uncharacterized protein
VTRVVEAPADLRTEVIGVPEGSDIELHLRLESVLDGVLVSGTAHGRAAGECVRCLDDVEVPFEASMTELYAYPGHTLDGVDGEQDDEVRELQDDLIDLEPALRDAVVPALPFRPLCREDCPGLCSECGARLADDPGHGHEQVDPRWQALAGLETAPADDRPAPPARP